MYVGHDYFIVLINSITLDSHLPTCYYIELQLPVIPDLTALRELIVNPYLRQEINVCCNGYYRLIWLLMLLV